MKPLSTLSLKPRGLRIRSDAVKQSKEDPSAEGRTKADEDSSLMALVSNPSEGGEGKSNSDFRAYFK